MGNERTEEAKAKESEVLDVNIPRKLWLKCETVNTQKRPSRISTPRAYYYGGFRKDVLYVPKGIITSKKYVDSLQEMLNVIIQPFN